jgi:dipeptide/tripeptide permease
MRVPNFSQWVAWSQAFALLVCGMIIGAALFMLVYQHNMNEILAANDTLRREKNELLDKIKDLEKYKNQHTVIKSIVVDIEDDPNEEAISEVIKNKIIENVKTALSVFKGKPISYLADTHTSQIARTLFGERRIPNIHDRDYIVEIKSIIVVYDEMKVRITAREWKDKD